MNQPAIVLVPHRSTLSGTTSCFALHSPGATRTWTILKGSAAPKTRKKIGEKNWGTVALTIYRFPDEMLRNGACVINPELAKSNNSATSKVRMLAGDIADHTCGHATVTR